MGKKQKCYICNGTGLLAPTIPSCKITALKYPWIVVEKCDTCDKFDDDLLAGSSKFKIIGWFLCSDGGYHALADSRSVITCFKGF